MIKFTLSQDTQLHQIIGSLMEPKPKLLAYRNVVPDPKIIPERGNRSKLVMLECGNRSIHHSTITITMYIITIIQQDVIHSI